MNNFVENFKFNGDWQFNLKLPLLSKIHSKHWHSNRYWELIRVLKSGYVPCEIKDLRNYQPEPTIAQINSLNYIIKEESDLLKHLFDIFTKKLNPQYTEYYGHDEWLPEIKSPHELGKLLRLNRIEIMTQEKDSFAYTTIEFEYLGDEEHGLDIILHKNRLIAFAGYGDLDFKKIQKDKKDYNEPKPKQPTISNEEGKGLVHQLLPKFGKLKPWQLEESQNYLHKLIFDNNYEILIKEIENNPWIINLRSSFYRRNLVDFAALQRNKIVIEYLFNTGGDFSNSVPQCVYYKDFSADMIKFLVEKGAPIDAFEDRYETPLGKEFKTFFSLFQDLVFNREKNNEEKVIRVLNSLKQCKTKMKFYISLGGNINRLNRDEEDYKSIILKDWSMEWAEKSKIFEEIEKLLPNKN